MGIACSARHTTSNNMTIHETHTDTHDQDHIADHHPQTLTYLHLRNEQMKIESQHTDDVMEPRRRWHRVTMVIAMTTTATRWK